MKRQWQYLIGFSVLSLALGCGGDTSSGGGRYESEIKNGKLLASQAGVEIHEGFLTFLKGLEPRMAERLQDPAGRKMLIDRALEQEILYRESIKRGLDKQQQNLDYLDLQRRTYLSQAVLKDEIETKAKEHYEKNKDSEFSQVKLAQILIKFEKPQESPKPSDPKPADAKPGTAPEAEKPAPDRTTLEAEAMKKAQDVKQKLDSGLSWEDAVKEFSDDARSKTKAGEIGKVSRKDRRIERWEWQELVDKAFGMKAGEVSGPIKTKEGYAIVKVLEAPSVASYEEVAERIKLEQRGPVRDELIKRLTGGKAVEYQDEELKKAPAAPKPGFPGAAPGAGSKPIEIKSSEVPSSATPAPSPAPDGAKPTPPSPVPAHPGHSHP